MAIIKLAGKGRSHGYTTCAITLSGTESSVADLEGYATYGLLVPTITSGILTFKGSNLETGTYYTIKDKDGSTDFAISNSAGNFAVESNDLDALIGYRYIKVISSTVQLGARTFIFTIKG